MFDTRLREAESGLPDTSAAELREAAYAVRSALRTERRRAARMQEVHESTGELVAMHNVDVVLREITSRARRILDCDYAYLNTPDEGSDESFAIRAWSGDLAPEFLGVRVMPNIGVGGVVLQTGEPFQVSNYAATSRIAKSPGYLKLLSAQGISTLLATPLTISGRITGLLFAARTKQEKFSDDEVFLLTALAQHAAIALQNAELDERRSRAMHELSVAAELSEAKRAEEERQSRLHARLSSIVLDGGDVSEVLAAVQDESGVELAYVDRASGPTVAVIRAESPTGSDTRTGGLADVPQPTSLAFPRGELPPPVVREVREGRRRWSAIDVVAYHRLLGHLVATQRALEDDSLARLLEWTSQAVALCQLSTQALADAERRSATEVVRKLVTSSSTSSDLRRKLQRSGIGDHGLRILLCDLADEAVRLRLTAWTVRHGGMAAVVDESAVVLAPAGVAGALWSLAEQVCSEYGTNVVLGRSVTDLTLIRSEYTNTLKSLQLARALGYRGETLRAEQFGIFSLLFTDPDADDLDSFISAQAGPLLESDSRHGTALAATALALLDHAGSLRAAAGELGVHPNTVMQRGSRIARLLGPQWREQPRAFEIHAALKLDALRAARR
ncbi:GAF domain-containing protein [Dietzia maris]|uniref:GAF domain-containing protein n=1 Tax=Dietzia maris TaxID=37915 RepID=UPI0015FDCD84|nr:GAF domain-containing protein [Dietzia sp. DQ11-71]